MAIFYNQANMTYNNQNYSSNIVSAELVEPLAATKTATPATYRAGDIITYVVSMVNSGTDGVTGLTVQDNMGGYAVGTNTVYPLSYEEGSLLYYVNGALMPTPSVTGTTPVTITNIAVPAGGNATLVYRAAVTAYAPLGTGSIVNTATITGASLAAPMTVQATITPTQAPNLAITKSVSPESVAENGTITYTFVIENTGNTPTTGDVIVTDTFNPILKNPTATYNGAAWMANVNYTYDAATGAFATLPGQITIPAASYTQNPTNGLVTTVPGAAVITVTGNL